MCTIPCIIRAFYRTDFVVNFDFIVVIFCDFFSDLSYEYPWSCLSHLNADILIPLDNYISRGTTHFLTCKEPDYHQSLWNVLSSVSDEFGLLSKIVSCYCLSSCVLNVNVLLRRIWKYVVMVFFKFTISFMLTDLLMYFVIPCDYYFLKRM